LISQVDPADHLALIIQDAMRSYLISEKRRGDESAGTSDQLFV